MKLAVSCDEYDPIMDSLVEELKKRGHEVHLFGPRNKQEASVDWPLVTEKAVKEVQQGRCDQAIILCWTGTGASITANKMKGIYAALCVDAETAKGARTYNHANVLALSLRLLSRGVLTEILDAWFKTPCGNDDWNQLQVNRVKELEAKVFSN